MRRKRFSTGYQEVVNDTRAGLPRRRNPKQLLGYARKS